ncbi:outer membrane protein assembly factor BamA [Lewinella aquimaris]|uniref:Outer membrane protein assembly factor BamA n=1 Tax=Neolewinella aquimaris TaxID=1835722 RepID=A0A840E575_9BACT|nr:BamA/TamA family outer membrane protein [Neolewinella aquimaris]MBB4079103.1 outer membrane protein assembly factor BamA [Neolewinella aquimaris]
MNLMVPELMGILAGGLRRVVPVLVAALLLTSCNVTKYLGDGEELLTAQRVAVAKGSKLENRSEVVYELSTLTRQKPNGNFLFLFPREHFYLANSKARDTTRIDRFLRNTIGQPPVLYSDSLSRRSAILMTDFLRYRGYFNATAYHEADRRRRKKVSLIYHVSPGARYVIDTVEYGSPEPQIDSILQVLKQESALQPGAPLNLTAFDEEKSRISQALRNEGYAYFSANYFDKLEIDTSQRKGHANIYLNILPPQQDDAYRKYRVGQITVLTDYSPARSATGTTYPGDTVVEGIRFLSPTVDFRMRPELLVDNIFLQQDSLYSREAYEKTNLSLGGLGIYRFVRINQVVDPNQDDVLNYEIQLSPNKRMAIGVDLDLNFTNRSLLDSTGSAGGAQNNNLIGISVSPNFRNRNVFGGAELLSISLRAGVEVNPSPDSSLQFFNTIDLAAEATLNLPRFKDFGLYGLARRTGLVSSDFYQQLRERASTRYSMAYEYLLIRTFYAYTTANARLGYDFRRSATTSYRINHAALDILNFTIEPQFEAILSTNQRLRRSISDQYFLSLLFRNLEYTRVGRPDRRGRSITFNGQFELTGAEMFLAQQLYDQLDTRNDFARYALLVADTRFAKQISPLRSIATRLLVGIGRPFNSDQELPYVKQFFAGGANSMRAWAPRGLGPGGYVDTLSIDNSSGSFNNNLRLYQTGDLQLELNLEYRFNLFSFVRGAIFTDIGNVWTIREDPDRPGSQFLLKGRIREEEGSTPFYHQPFYRQLAVAGGTGIRIDLSYFVFRLDAAIPLRYNYPQLGDGEPIRPREPISYPERAYWRSFDKFGLGDITFQLGLGYPF